MLALRTGGVVRRGRRVNSLTVVALVVTKLRPWCVPRIAVRELVFLGSIHLSASCHRNWIGNAKLTGLEGSRYSGCVSTLRTP